MKKRILIILECIITIALTIVILRCIGHRLDPAWSQDGFDVIDAFHSLEDDSLDVIVYGSSHAWKGCNTQYMNEKYNISAYNYGCNWQAINTTLLFLQDSLTTQNPKIVCIDTFCVGTVLKDTDLNGQIYYSSGIPDMKSKYKYLSRCFGKDPERWLSYYLPIVMFHDNWNTINYENYLNQGYQRFVDSKGYMAQYNVYEGYIPDYKGFTQLELPVDSLQILDEIVYECKKRNIQIIFYTCPWQGEYSYGYAMTKYAEENGCIYINFFENLNETGIDGATDLNDEGHLNLSGATKVADYLGKFIVENYDI